jgi:branched-chain amino acid aminotransferase
MPVIVAEAPAHLPASASIPAIKSLNYLNNILAKVEADRGRRARGDHAEHRRPGLPSRRGRQHLPRPRDGRRRDAAARFRQGLLSGVTRLFVIDTSCPALGFACRERHLSLDDVFAADEVFLTGTAAEVIGVSSIDGRVLGEGKVGPSSTPGSSPSSSRGWPRTLPN